jgi:hypothetical protein
MHNNNQITKEQAICDRFTKAIADGNEDATYVELRNIVALLKQGVGFEMELLSYDSPKIEEEQK